MISLFICLNNHIHAQERGFQTFFDFESSNGYFQVDTTAQTLWQIGSPNKINFDTSYSPVKSIITDTINSYPSNDSSFFTLIYSPVENYLGGIYDDIRYEFYHRFITDTINDYGKVMMSIDGGQSWINAFSDSLNSIGSSPDHYFESTGLSYSGDLQISGNSGGWVRSTFMKDLDQWIYNMTGNPPSPWNGIDSIMVRFIFKSDSIQNNSDGWQIDDFTMTHYYPVSVSEINEKEVFCFPNPAHNYLYFTKDIFTRDEEIFIFDAIGKIISQTFLSENNSVNISDLESGIYYLKSKNSFIRFIKL